jgi:hypothetical protein
MNPNLLTRPDSPVGAVQESLILLMKELHLSHLVEITDAREEKT